MCPGLWNTIDEQHKNRYRDNAETLFPALIAPADPVPDADLAAIDVPVLVITGADSHPALRTIAAGSPAASHRASSSNSHTAATSPKPNNRRLSPQPSAPSPPAVPQPMR
jgi:hypothetical protein